MPKRPPRVVKELPIPRDLRGSEPRIAIETTLGTLWRSDAVELLQTVKDRSVDLVVADPPYAISKDSWDEFESRDAYLDWTAVWLGEVARVLTPSGSAYVCGFSEILAHIQVRVEKHFPGGCRWLIWHYRNKANLGSDWGRSHEAILHLRMAKKNRLNVDDVRIPYNDHTKRYPERVQAVSSQYGKGVRRDRWVPHPLGAKPRDVIELPVLCNGTAEKTPHPTQKPQELIRKFVAGSSNVGDLVVDPFSGSGTTALVAEQLGRRWIAGDADPRYVELARKRLKDATS